MVLLDYLVNLEKETSGKFKYLGKVNNNSKDYIIQHQNDFCFNLIFKVRTTSKTSKIVCPVCDEHKYATGDYLKNKFMYDIAEKIPNIEFLTEYCGNTKKIKFQHKDDNEIHVFEDTPKNFYKKEIFCPKCRRNLKILEDTKNFNNYVEDAYEGEYTCLTPYYGCQKYVTMRHNHSKCNNFEYEVQPINFKHGYKCPKCRGYYKTTAEFKEILFENLGEGYELVSEYCGRNKKVDILHLKCGRVYSTAVACIYRGHRCPNCSHSRHKTLEEVKKEVYDLVEDEYTILSDKYINTMTPLRFRHNSTKCNNSEFEVQPVYFKQGRRCPICNETNGELEVRRVLTKYNINFKAQYCMIKNPETNHYLRNDFVLFDSKDSIIGAIEYDGEGHYIPIKKYGGEKLFEARKKRDTYKEDWLKKNNIPLLRIPYWDFKKIEELVVEFLKTLRLML